MLAKVVPIESKAGNQAKAEALVEAFAPKGPGQEDGTLSFRVYRDPKRPDYLLIVEFDHELVTRTPGSAILRPNRAPGTLSTC